MHTVLRDDTTKRVRRQAARKASNKFKGAHAFAMGDLVMVAGKGNSANVARRAKIMMKWQRPYQIVRQASVAELRIGHDASATRDKAWGSPLSWP